MCFKHIGDIAWLTDLSLKYLLKHIEATYSGSLQLLHRFGNQNEEVNIVLLFFVGFSFFFITNLKKLGPRVTPMHGNKIKWRGMVSHLCTSCF